MKDGEFDERHSSMETIKKLHAYISAYQFRAMLTGNQGNDDSRNQQNKTQTYFVSKERKDKVNFQKNS